MNCVKKVALKIHDMMFAQRCETRPGIAYFDESHYQRLIKDNFEFVNRNHFTLRGGIYHYDNYDKKQLIVFCHGVGGGHQAYMQEINYLAQAGYQVLGIDYQGTILSDGDKINGFGQGISDMVDCLNQIKDNYAEIIVIGHSWGGWIAQALANEFAEVKKIVLLSGMNNLKAVIKQYSPWYLAFARKSFINIEKERYPQYYLSSGEITLNKPGLKALVLQSKDDPVLKYKLHFQPMKKKCQNPDVKFISFEGKKHNTTYTYEAVNNLAKYLHHLNQITDMDEARKLAKETQWDTLCDLDEKVMNQIINFIKE